MYMDVRIPTPINSNPGMVLPPRTFHTVNDVARFAAQVINGIMEHKEIIDRYIFTSVFLFGQIFVSLFHINRDHLVRFQFVHLN